VIINTLFLGSNFYFPVTSTFNNKNFKKAKTFILFLGFMSIGADKKQRLLAYAPLIARCSTEVCF
jgi:hypothetical protein